MDLLRGIVKAKKAPYKKRSPTASSSAPQAIHLTEDGVEVNRGPSYTDSRNLWTPNRTNSTANTRRQTRKRRPDLVVGAMMPKSKAPLKLNRKEKAQGMYFVTQGNNLVVMSSKRNSTPSPTLVPDHNISMLGEDGMELDETSHESGHDNIDSDAPYPEPFGDGIDFGTPDMITAEDVIHVHDVQPFLTPKQKRLQEKEKVAKMWRSRTIPSILDIFIQTQNKIFKQEEIPLVVEAKGLWCSLHKLTTRQRTVDLVSHTGIHHPCCLTLAAEAHNLFCNSTGVRQLSLTVCVHCQTLPQLLVRLGYFGTTPQWPTLAFSFDIYRLYITKNAFKKTSMDSFIRALVEQLRYRGVQFTIQQPLLKAFESSAHWFDSLLWRVERRVKSLIWDEEYPDKLQTIAMETGGDVEIIDGDAEDDAPRWIDDDNWQEVSDEDDHNVTSKNVECDTDANADGLKPGKAHPYLVNQCPRCFGRQYWGGDPETNPDVLVAGDGNMQAKQLGRVPNDPKLFSTWPDSMYLPEEAAKEAEKHVNFCRAESKKKGKKTRSKKKTAVDDIPKSAITDCYNSYKAAREKGAAMNGDYFRLKGVMALVCNHDIPLVMVNITTPGERQFHMIAMLKWLFERLPPHATVGLHYDVVCILAQSFSQHGYLSSIAHRLSFALAVFHALGHVYCCQVVLSPQFRPGFGTNGGEGNERLWSQIQDLIAPARHTAIVKRELVANRRLQKVTEIKKGNLQLLNRKQWKKLEKLEAEATAVIIKARHPDGTPWEQQELLEQFELKKKAHLSAKEANMKNTAQNINKLHEASRSCNALKKALKEVTKLLEDDDYATSLRAPLAGQEEAGMEARQGLCEMALGLAQRQDACAADVERLANEIGLAQVQIPDGMSSEDSVYLRHLVFIQSLKTVLCGKVIAFKDEYQPLKDSTSKAGHELSLGTRSLGEQTERAKERRRQVDKVVQRMNDVGKLVMGMTKPDWLPDCYVPTILDSTRYLYMDPSDEAWDELFDNSVWKNSWISEGEIPQAPDYVRDSNVNKALKPALRLERIKESRARLQIEQQSAETVWEFEVTQVQALLRKYKDHPLEHRFSIELQKLFDRRPTPSQRKHSIIWSWSLKSAMDLLQLDNNAENTLPDSRLIPFPQDGGDANMFGNPIEDFGKPIVDVANPIPDALRHVSQPSTDHLIPFTDRGGDVNMFDNASSNDCIADEEGDDGVFADAAFPAILPESTGIPAGILDTADVFKSQQESLLVNESDESIAGSLFGDFDDEEKVEEISDDDDLPEGDLLQASFEESCENVEENVTPVPAPPAASLAALTLQDNGTGLKLPPLRITQTDLALPGGYDLSHNNASNYHDLSAMQRWQNHQERTSASASRPLPPISILFNSLKTSSPSTPNNDLEEAARLEDLRRKVVHSAMTAVVKFYDDTKPSDGLPRLWRGNVFSPSEVDSLNERRHLNASVAQAAVKMLQQHLNRKAGELLMNAAGGVLIPIVWICDILMDPLGIDKAKVFEVAGNAFCDRTHIQQPDPMDAQAWLFPLGNLAKDFWALATVIFDRKLIVLSYPDNLKPKYIEQLQQVLEEVVQFGCETIAKEPPHFKWALAPRKVTPLTDAGWWMLADVFQSIIGGTTAFREFELQSFRKMIKAWFQDLPTAQPCDTTKLVGGKVADKDVKVDV